MTNLSAPMPARRAAEVPRSYLLVFRPGSSLLAPLPAEGNCAVGSSEQAWLRLTDEGIAPLHALLAVTEGEVILQPGEGATALNGATVSTPRPLASGDRIELGSVSLVFHDDLRRPVRRALEAPALRRRLHEEVERVKRTGRPLAIFVVDVGEVDSESAARASDAALETVRLMDVVGWSAAGELVVLLPDTGERARIPAGRLLQALKPIVPEARLGMALCPSDAREADALLVGARDAARRAAIGGMAVVDDAAGLLTLGGGTLVVADPLTHNLVGLVQRLAPSGMPVLLSGETGAGKELIAHALHEWSPRRERPMVAINCAAVTDTLFESELFGHERGAFTGAVSAKQGLFERADGGTVFLDEVGECSPSAQAKLLRAIETKRVTRVGSVHEQAVDVRIIAATNRSLEAEVAAGRFRQDLFYRLGAATVIVPPLRDRPLDLPVLARRFLDEACGRLGRAPLSLSDGAMHQLAQYRWPGNVRELRNTMDYLAATVEGPELGPEALPEKIRGASLRTIGGDDAGPQAGPARKFASLYEEIRELERVRIQEALAEAGGVRVRAADKLGMPLRTLVTKLKEYQIRTPSPRTSRKGRGE